MGAWVAYELAHTLQQAGVTPPLHLFVSGNRCVAGGAAVCSRWCFSKRCATTEAAPAHGAVRQQLLQGVPFSCTCLARQLCMDAQQLEGSHRPHML
jgi:hypothetical protein